MSIQLLLGGATVRFFLSLWNGDNKRGNVQATTTVEQIMLTMSLNDGCGGRKGSCCRPEWSAGSHQRALGLDSVGRYIQSLIIQQRRVAHLSTTSNACSGSSGA